MADDLEEMSRDVAETNAIAQALEKTKSDAASHQLNAEALRTLVTISQMEHGQEQLDQIEDLGVKAYEVQDDLPDETLDLLDQAIISIREKHGIESVPNENHLSRDEVDHDHEI